METINEKLVLDFYTTTFRGLENNLEKEITKSNGNVISVYPGIINFKSNIIDCQRLMYNSYLANKIVWIISRKKIFNEKQLYNQAFNIDWPSYFSLKNTFAVKTVLMGTRFSHSGFCALKIKDAIADKFRKKFGKRPNVDKNSPDIPIETRIFKQNSIIGINICGEPLYKRGYRTGTNAAPMKETLAAGVISLIRNINDKDLKKKIIDPMCGSGTIIIESALQLLNISPSELRSIYALNKIILLKNFLLTKPNRNLSLEMKNTDFKFIACDHTPAFINQTKDNIKNTGLDNLIEIKKQNFFKPVIDMTNSIIIFNPPYGKRLAGAKNINEFYKKIGDTMKNYCKGSTVYIFTKYDEHIKSIGLRTSKRIILFNGKIECRLLEYKIF